MTGIPLCLPHGRACRGTTLAFRVHIDKVARYVKRITPHIGGCAKTGVVEPAKPKVARTAPGLAAFGPVMTMDLDAAR